MVKEPTFNCSAKTMPVQPPTKSPSAVADRPGNTHAKTPGIMSEKMPEKQFDPFHPDMPEIPGLVDARRHAPDGTRTKRVVPIGVIVVVVILAVISIVWWIKSAQRPVVESSSANGTIAESSVPIPPPAESAKSLPVVAATPEELSKPWAAKGFSFENPLTREPVNAVVIRLPGGGLWAFALKEPYGQCKLEFVTDLAQLAKQYGYRASHPMVGNPCNRTVYDPLKVGPMGTAEWARGEIVQGSGIRPPISINVQVIGHAIIADRME
jgi:hypothetical protein